MSAPRLRFVRTQAEEETPLVGFVNFDGLSRDYYQLDPATVSGSNPTGYWANTGGALLGTPGTNPNRILYPEVNAWAGDNGSVDSRGDQIVTGASRSGAAGDRGLRNMLGVGHNQGGGGIRIEFGQAMPDVYLKFWVKYPTGLFPATETGSGPFFESTPGNWHYIKLIDFDNTTNLTLPRVTWGPGQEGSSANFGFGTFFPTVQYGCNLHSGGQLTWAEMNSGDGTHGDGLWHSHQIRMKKETAAGNDGIAEFWFDGVKVMSETTIGAYTGATLTGNALYTDATYPGWTYAAVVVNQAWVRDVSTDYYIDMDDFMWSDQFITQDAP